MYVCGFSGFGCALIFKGLNLLYIEDEITKKLTIRYIQEIQEQEALYSDEGTRPKIIGH